MTLTLTSKTFRQGGKIERAHTCEGEDLSPALTWTGVPPESRSLVLIMDDPDAPDPAAPRRTWVHWVLYDLPVEPAGLPEGTRRETLPRGARAGLNDFGVPDYRGPCPPVGRHRYFFKLYALDTVLPDLGPATKAQVEEAMRGHVVAHAELMATYQKGDL